MRTQSALGTAAGLLAFVVGLVGYTVFDWRFSDGASNPVAFGIALLAVAVAIGVTLRNRL